MSGLARSICAHANPSGASEMVTTPPWPTKGAPVSRWAGPTSEYCESQGGEGGASDIRRERAVEGRG
eukprot:1329347-Rhodomonas_salina.1